MLRCCTELSVSAPGCTGLLPETITAGSVLLKISDSAPDSALTVLFADTDNLRLTLACALAALDTTENPLLCFVDRSGDALIRTCAVTDMLGIPAVRLRPGVRADISAFARTAASAAASPSRPDPVPLLPELSEALMFVQPFLPSRLRGEAISLLTGEKEGLCDAVRDRSGMSADRASRLYADSMERAAESVILRCTDRPVSPAPPPTELRCVCSLALVMLLLAAVSLLSAPAVRYISALSGNSNPPAQPLDRAIKLFIAALSSVLPTAAALAALMTAADRFSLFPACSPYIRRMLLGRAPLLISLAGAAGASAAESGLLSFALVLLFCGLTALCTPTAERRALFLPPRRKRPLPDSSVLILRDTLPSALAAAVLALPTGAVLTPEALAAIAPSAAVFVACLPVTGKNGNTGGGKSSSVLQTAAGILFGVLCALVTN